jgi:uncharacterized protein YjbJ (UPF0337 family)
MFPAPALMPIPFQGWTMTERRTDHRDDEDLASEGLKDELKGTAKKVEGRIRSAVGGASGDTGEQLKGKAQEIKGKVQQGVGRAKERLDPNPGVEDE